MFMTFIHAAATALGGVCLATAGCVSAAVDVLPGHPAHPRSEAAPLLLATSLALPSPEGESVPAEQAGVHPGAVHHAHGAPGHEHAAHAGALTGSGADEGAQVRYTCPMHPEIVRDAPGSCPVCGMHLVKQKPPAPPEGAE